MDEPTFRPGMAERAIDTATDVSRTVGEVTGALHAAVERLTEAVDCRAAAGTAAVHHQRHHPRSAAGQPVRGVPVRDSGGPPALAETGAVSPLALAMHGP